MKKVNFSELVIKDITWSEINIKEATQGSFDKIEKLIWNYLFYWLKNIELSEISKRIYNWEEVELREQDIDVFIQIIEDSKLSPLFEREIVNFLK